MTDLLSHRSDMAASASTCPEVFSSARRSLSIAVEAGDGLLLAGWSHLPATPHADVVIVHGYAEHSDRYGFLVEALLGHGYACHLFDLRGHGASAGPRGHVARFALYRDDLLRFLRRAELPGPRPRRPAVLLGHSLGGLIALDFLLRCAGGQDLFDALILSSPYLASASHFAALWRVAARLLALIVPRLRLSVAPSPEGLSRDPVQVAAYAADPRVVRTVTPGWAAQVFAAQDRVFAQAAEITLPTLCLAGSADPIADLDRTRDFFARLGSDDKRLTVYEGFLHEVLNELGRERVVSDILTWLDRRSAPRGKSLRATARRRRPS